MGVRFQSGFESLPEQSLNQSKIACSLLHHPYVLVSNLWLFHITQDKNREKERGEINK